MATRMYVCESVEHPTTLLISLNEQRLKGLLCDITVRVQGHLFKAHVNVLASAMGYFRDLFYKPTKEKVDGIVEIPMIVNSIGFSKVLDFVYTSQLCLSQSTVMQVLCSACYLQIPYVVEKCQEFISTHGHVTSQSSLNAVTGPLLQGLQHNGGNSFPNQQSHAQSASASLSLLSQLNQASEKSRARALTTNPATQNKTSPPRMHESDEHQECELINTPPSPGSRSLTNGDDRATTSPNCSNDMKPENLVSVKKEKYGSSIYENGEYNNSNNIDQSNEEKRTAYSPQERYPQSVNGADEPNHLSQIKKLLAAGNRPFSLTNGDAQDIDHKSLADYFSTDQQNKERPPNAYPFIFEGNNAVVKTKSTSADQHIFSMTKNWARDKPTTDAPPNYTLVPKKEKPKKEYKCEYCQKMFGRQQHLKRHILTHTGERPYPCTYCDKRFRRSEHLKHHLVNHEQALGITIVQSKKRQRRVDREDAYSLSKMMLDSYSQPSRVSPTPAITMSGPVILPSMFSDTGIGRRNSPGPQITEIEEANVEMNGNYEGQQNSPYASEENTPMIALNLTRPQALDMNRQPALDLAVGSGPPEKTDGLDSSPVLNVSAEDNKMAEGGEEENRNSSDSNSLMGFENGTNSDLINMEGSEVLTSDLKRLMAAMDE